MFFMAINEFIRFFIGKLSLHIGYLQFISVLCCQLISIQLNAHKYEFIGLDVL